MVPKHKGARFPDSVIFPFVFQWDFVTSYLCACLCLLNICIYTSSMFVYSIKHLKYSYVCNGNIEICCYFQKILLLFLVFTLGVLLPCTNYRL